LLPEGVAQPVFDDRILGATPVSAALRGHQAIVAARDTVGQANARPVMGQMGWSMLRANTELTQPCTKVLDVPTIAR
jgi:hypothetical protein